MLALLMFLVQNKNLFLRNNENLNLDTTQTNNLFLPQANLSIYQKGAYYLQIKISNNLPLEIKNFAGNQRKLKLFWKELLLILHNWGAPQSIVNEKLYQYFIIVLCWFEVFICA